MYTPVLMKFFECKDVSLYITKPWNVKKLFKPQSLFYISEYETCKKKGEKPFQEFSN